MLYTLCCVPVRSAQIYWSKSYSQNVDEDLDELLIAHLEELKDVDDEWKDVADEENLDEK